VNEAESAIIAAIDTNQLERFYAYWLRCPGSNLSDASGDCMHRHDIHCHSVW